MTALLLIIRSGPKWGWAPPCRVRPPARAAAPSSRGGLLREEGEMGAGCGNYTWRTGLDEARWTGARKHVPLRVSKGRKGALEHSAD